MWCNHEVRPRFLLLIGLDYGELSHVRETCGGTVQVVSEPMGSCMGSTHGFHPKYLKLLVPNVGGTHGTHKTRFPCAPDGIYTGLL